MAWTTSANPWGSFDLADAAERNRALGLNWLNSVKKIGIRGGLRIAGGVHLALLVNWAGTDASGLAAMLSGLAMMTLAWVPTRLWNVDGSSVRGSAASINEASRDAIPASAPAPNLAGATRPPNLSRFDLHAAAAGLETWSDLTARISHELRTPLNAIIGFSEMMDAEILGPVGNARYREYLAHIRDSGSELLKSTEDTLALIELMGRVEQPCPRQSVELAGVVREVCGGGSEDLSRVDEAEVVGDRRMLRQILVNLLEAARHRAGKRGQVAVTARCEGSRVILAVRVTGEPPFKNCDAGHLPLCLARTLLELHGLTLIEGAGDTDSRGPAGWQAVTVLDRAVQPDFFERARAS